MRCLRPAYVAYGDRQGLYRCGKCYHCRVVRQRHWVYRLSGELATSVDARFLTLTYNDEHMPRCGSVGVLIKDHVQRYLKRVRKQLQGIDVRYFAAGEYGEKTGRPHYHIVMFFDSQLSDEMKLSLTRCWEYGFVQDLPVRQEALAYVAGYVSKKLLSAAHDDVDRPAEFFVSSKGIGGEWFRENLYEMLASGVFRTAVVLPRYYINVLESYYPDIAAGMRANAEWRAEIALADRILELAPTYGGRLFEQLDADEKIDVIQKIALRSYEEYDLVQSDRKSKMYVEVTNE